MQNITMMAWAIWFMANKISMASGNTLIQKLGNKQRIVMFGSVTKQVGLL